MHYYTLHRITNTQYYIYLHLMYRDGFIYWYKALENSTVIGISISMDFFKVNGPTILEKNPHGPPLQFGCNGGLRTPTFCSFAGVFLWKEKTQNL